MPRKRDPDEDEEEDDVEDQEPDEEYEEEEEEVSQFVHRNTPQRLPLPAHLLPIRVSLRQ